MRSCALFFFAFFITVPAAQAADMLEVLNQNGSMPMLRGGVIALCLAIAFLTSAVRTSLGDEEFSTSHLLMRCLLVVLAILAAPRIQGFLVGMGQGIADSFFPGPSFDELRTTLADRVVHLLRQQGDVADTSGHFDPTTWIPFLSLKAQIWAEEAALFFFSFVFHWFQAVQHVVMMLLGFMAPFMLAATIIPGVNGFSNWLKLVISVALWPVVASFFLKSHLLSATSYLTSPVQTYLDIDTLQLIIEAGMFGFFMLATPLIAAGIVQGSASAFAAGSSFLMAGGMLAPALVPYRALKTGIGTAMTTKNALISEKQDSVKSIVVQPFSQMFSNISKSAKYVPSSPGKTSPTSSSSKKGNSNA